MNHQHKVMLIWFPIQFITTSIAIVTRDTWAIDSALFSMMAIGLCITFEGVKNAFLSLKSRYWPSIEPEAVNPRITQTSNMPELTSRYKVNSELTYEVNGHEYSLTIHDLNIPTFKTRSEAEEYLNSIVSKKNNHTLFYNPKNPNQAYLNPGKISEFLQGIFWGSLIAVIPFLTIIGYIKWR